MLRQPTRVPIRNVTANITVTASFAINTYTLTYTAGANGSITGVESSDGESRCKRDGGDGGSGDGVSLCAVERRVRQPTRGPIRNVTANITVTASFAINTYTLTYTAGANGSITGVSPQTVNHGASGTAVTAVPATGYHFVQWSDAVDSQPADRYQRDREYYGDGELCDQHLHADVQCGGQRVDHRGRVRRQ